MLIRECNRPKHYPAASRYNGVMEMFVRWAFRDMWTKRSGLLFNYLALLVNTTMRFAHFSTWHEKTHNIVIPTTSSVCKQR